MRFTIVPPCRTFAKAALTALLASLLLSCEAAEPNPVREEEGPPNPAVENDDTMPPTVAPPSGVELTPEEPEDEAWVAPDDHKQSKFLGLVTDKPATWIEHPPATSMELTRYTVPGREGNPAAEIVVFYFGEGMGGSAQDNIERWRGQFRRNEDGSLVDADVTELEAGENIGITLVEILGDWMRMGAASHTTDQHFVAAIVECPRGPLFIRFVGHEDTVGPNRDAFVEMMTSLRVEE